jgi:uncharacterized protein (DUF58 family)
MTEETPLPKRIQGLSLLAKEKVKSFLTGNRRSVLLGQGSDFSDLRDYVPGDDLRHIDWRATARRKDTLIVRDYDLERNTNIVIILDTSASMLLGKKKTRIQVATEATASLVYAATSNKDFIGFGAFSNELNVFIPPKGGKSHEFFIYRQLLNLIPSGETSIGESLKNVATKLKRKSLILVISDLHDAVEDTINGFKIARAFNHEVQLLQITDYGEFILPDKVGKIKFNNPKTGKPEVIDFSNRITKGLYHYQISNSLNKLNDFKRNLRGLKVRVVETRTDDLTDKVLYAYYSSKSRFANV